MAVFHAIKQFQNVAGFILLLFFATFFVYGCILDSSKAALMQQELEQEFNNIKPFPQAKACNYRASHKTSQALVGSSYCTKLSFSEIRTYYDAELTSHGWRFQREESLRDWGRDFGGKSISYCKGEYKASLQYAGENVDYGWNYALDLSWGLGSFYDKWKGNLCQ